MTEGAGRQERRPCRRDGAWLLVAALTLAACDGGLPPPTGVVVEVVEPGYAAGRAGVEPGDVLLSWERRGGGEVAPLRSPLAVRQVEVEESWRGGIVLHAWRGDAALRLELPPGAWRLTVRPALTAAASDGDRRARALLADGQAEAAAQRWSALAAATPDAELGSWWRLHAGRALLTAGFEELGRAFLERASAGVEDPRTALWVWEERGTTSGEANDHGAARDAFDAALELAPDAGGWPPTLLYERAAAAFRLSLTQQAEADLSAALGRWRELRPGTAGEVDCLLLLAKIERNRGRLAAAGALLDDALAHAAALDPQGPAVAAAHTELAVVAERRGELDEAAGLYRRALAGYQRLGMAGTEVATAAMGLGNLAWQRGELAEAEGRFRDALDIFRRDAPGSYYEAWSVTNLGLVAHDRGELAVAEGYYRRGLEIRRRLAPEGTDVAMSLVNLGAVAHDRDDPAAAEGAYRKALAIARKVVPGSELEAYLLGNLGGLAVEAGRLDAAAELYRGAAAILGKIAPGGLDDAECRRRLGELARARGRYEEAEARLAESLEIRRRLAPGSAAEAESLHDLGTLYRELGRRREALEQLRAAAAALETQRGRLGGGAAAGSHFSARYADVYRDLADLELELGEEGAAFHTLERYRARSFLALLAERDLALDDDLPAELADEQRRLARQEEQAREELARLDAAAPAAQVEERVARLRQLADERRALTDRLRRQAPRYAALTTPAPLDLEATRAALEPGTLLLSYLVLERSTLLFALGPAPRGLTAVRVPLGRQALAGRVEALRYLLESPQAGATARRALRRRAAELYRLLVAPVAARLAGADRLLVVADGPLHSLPFAALVVETGSDGPVYLVERLPVHRAASATVYAELRRASSQHPEATATGPLAAFGGAVRPGGNAAAGGAAAALLSGRDLPPLPAARGEVAAIAALYGAAGHAWIGGEASEERVKSLDRRVRLLHFACHAVVDDRLPLSSFLALSPPSDAAAGDGLLEAWEVLEQLHLDAELVTLSACETGLGEELDGEGLVGLTRAFQHAGARSVIASLWRVADRSTALFMERLYGHLRAGMPKAAALAAAQRDFLNGPRELPPIAEEPAGGWLASLRSLFGTGTAPPPGPSLDPTHPFYWAAFVLEGGDG